MNENIELMEMKQQMQLLKQRLDEQVSINDNQVRKAIKSGMSNIVRREMMGLIACAAMTVILPLFEYATFFSGTMAIFTFVWLLCATACQYFEMRYVMNTDKMRDTNLVDMQTRLVNYKRLEYKLLLYFGVPMVLIFIIAYGVDIYFSDMVQNDADGMTLFIAMCIGGAIGGIIGGCIGYFGFFKKQMREIDEVSERIEEIKR